MANYNNLKTAIQAVIKANGNQEITGEILQNALLSMINSLGAGYQFMGVATPETASGIPDQKVFYIANGSGTYSNFGGINVDKDEVAILTFDDTWKKLATGIVSTEKLSDVMKQMIYDVSANNHGAAFDSLSALLSNDNLSTLIPSSVRCGGMSIRFIQSSGNKYVQYRLMADEFTIDNTQWAIADEGVYVENPEFISVETDNDGKILASRNNKGVKKEYAGFETPKISIDGHVIENIEDPEERSEITTDLEGRIIAYRDNKGAKHEKVGIETPKLILSNEGLDDLRKALKAGGYGNVMDWSDEEFIELPIPEVCAIVNFGIDSQATSKSDRPDFEPGVNGEIPTYMEYWDKKGNYFKKQILLSAQGSSSMAYVIKNQAVDINDDSKLKFGNWVAQDSFHIKKYYIDIFRGQCIVGYWLTEQMYQTYPYGERRPWDYLIKNNDTKNSFGDVNKDFSTGALAHPDGFPVLVYFNGKCNGLYAFNLKKHRDNYYQNKKNTNHIILDGDLSEHTLWGNINTSGTVDWSQFEIRNPKPKKKSDGWELVNINNEKYNGDFPTELMGEENLGYDATNLSHVKSNATKKNILRIAGALKAIANNPTKETYEQYFNSKFVIEYYLISNVLLHYDGFAKNWIWCVWDGNIWAPTSYDMDSIFGMHWEGTWIVNDSWKLGGTEGEPTYYMAKNRLYWDEVKTRYAYLRQHNVFTVDNIVGLLEKWVNICGYDNIKNEIDLYASQTPSYRKDLTNTSYWKFDARMEYHSPVPDEYNPEKSYNTGELVLFKNYVYTAIQNVPAGIQPSDTYSDYPYVGGFFNSIQRVKNWLIKRFEVLDEYFEYNINL